MNYEARGKDWFPVVLESYDRIEAIFETLTREHPFALKDEWYSDALVEPEAPILWDKSPEVQIVARHADTIYKLYKSTTGSVSVQVRARSEAGARATMRFLKDAMPAIDPPKNAVKFEFVRLSVGHVDRHARSIVVPRFDEIRENYAPETRRAVEDLLKRPLRDDLSGRILLWHGPPGTGKTYMLRALAREWKGKVRVVYVIDPENFLAKTMDYITAVTLEDDSEESDGGPPWTLIVLEDAGEFFAAEHTARLEQGISRLLNFSDGILGQGLRCMFLLTTNKRIHQIHPALTRPGRCLANIHFAPLGARDAKKWFSRRGISNAPRGERVLAELYSISEDQAPIEGPNVTPAGGVEVQ